MGTLYVVATPIGNLEDITLRALRVLREVRLIAAEDTRTARKLLTRYEIPTPTTSYFEHNEVLKTPAILHELGLGDVGRSSSSRRRTASAKAWPTSRVPSAIARRQRPAN